MPGEWERIAIWLQSAEIEYIERLKKLGMASPRDYYVLINSLRLCHFQVVIASSFLALSTIKTVRNR